MVYALNLFNFVEGRENDYREYTFNARNLPQFNGFQIKIIMTGTNYA